MTHLRIELNNIPENVSSGVITKLYELATSGDLDSYSNLAGTLHTNATYLHYINGIRENYPELYITSDVIYFAFLDPEVLRLMSAAYGDGTGVTTLQLMSISSLGDMFKENTDIVSFGELGDITGVTNIGVYDFYMCTNLEYVDLSNITTITASGGNEENYAFRGCMNLFKNTGILHMPKLTYISGKMFGWVDDDHANRYVKMIIAELLSCCRRSNYVFDLFCKNLKALICPNLYYSQNNDWLTIEFNIIGDYYHPNAIIGYHGELIVAEFGKVDYITKNALRYNTKLLALVLHLQDTVPTLNSYSSGDLLTSYFPNANISIYVPDNMVATILADSVWSNFSSHIKPISEYSFSNYIQDSDLVSYYNGVFNSQS